MRLAAVTCAVLAVLLAGFSWWGLGTAAGLRQFDEMAGLIPFWAGLLGAVLGVCAIGLAWRAGRSRR